MQWLSFIGRTAGIRSCTAVTNVPSFGDVTDRRRGTDSRRHALEAPCIDRQPEGLVAYFAVGYNSNLCLQALRVRWRLRLEAQRFLSSIDGPRTRSVRGSAGCWSFLRSRTRRGGSVWSRSVPSLALRRRPGSFSRSSGASPDHFWRRAAPFEGTRDPRFVACCPCPLDSAISRERQPARRRRNTNRRWRESGPLHRCITRRLCTHLKTGAISRRGRWRNCERICRAGERHRQQRRMNPPHHH